MVRALGDGVPLIGDTGEEISRTRTSKCSDSPLSTKRKNDTDERRSKRNRLSFPSSSS